MLSPGQTHRRDSRSNPRQSSSTSTEPYPSRRPSSALLHADSVDGFPIRNKRRGNTRASPLPGPALSPLHRLDRYADRSPPRELPPLAIPSSPPPYIDARHRSTLVSRRRPTSVLSLNGPSMTYPPVPPPARNMLERTFRILTQPAICTDTMSHLSIEAWHVVMTTDPLENSEDEADENTRLDLRE